MSPLGQADLERRLFDHLVGAGEYCRRNCKAQRLRGFQIDHQLELGRRLHWEVGRLLAFENAIDITRRTAVWVNCITSIRD